MLAPEKCSFATESHREPLATGRAARFPVRAAAHSPSGAPQGLKLLLASLLWIILAPISALLVTVTKILQARKVLFPRNDLA